MTWLELLLAFNLAIGVALCLTEYQVWRAEQARRDALDRLRSALAHPTSPGLAMSPCRCGYALLAVGRALLCCGTLHGHTLCAPDVEAIR